MALHVWAAVASLADGGTTTPTLVVARNALGALSTFPALNRWFGTEGARFRDVALFYVGPMPQDMDAQAYLQRLDVELPFSPKCCVEWFSEQAKRHTEETAPEYRDEGSGI